MKNIPEKIYLIIGDECPSDANFKDLREVTWSSNSNFKNDIEYVLATEDKKAPEHEFTCQTCGGHEKEWSRKNDDWYCKTCGYCCTRN